MNTSLQADEKRGKRVWMNLTPTLLDEHREIVTELLETAVAEVEG